MAVVSTRSAVNLLLKETCAKFNQAEAGKAIDVLKRSYPKTRDLFDQNDLYHAFKQLCELGAIDPDDGDTKLLELLAEKTSKKEEVLKLIKESTSTRKKEFVGRDADVDKTLKLVSNPRVPGVNLYGESGVGKTTLVKEVSKNLKDFETKFIDLRDIKDMNTVYFLALEAFKLPAWDYSKERFYSHLQSLTAKTLLILDSVEELLFEESQNDQETRAEFVEFLNVVVANEASKKGHLKVVLTSRIQISDPALKGKLFTEYNVQPLSKDVSKDFISKRVKSDISNDEQDKALFGIAELCRDKPYLLQEAEQLMRQSYTSPVDVLRKITTQTKNGVPEEFACINALFDSLPSDHLRQLAVKISLLRRPFSVSTAMKIAEISSDYGAEWDLEMLVNHKIITAEDVEGKRKYDLHALFREFVTSYLCKVVVYKDVYLKAEQQFVEHFSEKLIKLANILDKDFVLTYQKVIKDKANFDLTIDITTRSETFDLILHSENLMEAGRVVVLFRAFKNIKERKELFGKWAEIMESKGIWLSSANLRCWESIQLADMEGTRNACETLTRAEESLVKAMLTSTPEKLIAAKGLFKYCWGKINYMSSENLIDESSKQKKEQLLRQALCDLEESLDIHRKVYGDHTLTARTLNLIGNCYMGLDEPENALSFYQEAMDMKVKLVGSEEHFDIPTYYNQLSQAYETLGDKTTSSWSFRRALQSFLSLFFAPQRKRQCYELAVDNLSKALNLQKVLGVDDSVDTATFQRNLANILIGLEQYDQALEYAQESYKIRSTLLGKHPETVRILYLIGVIHEWRKDHKAALQSYEKAFEMEESLPEDNHSVVRKRLCDRLEAMCRKLEKEKLEEYGPRIKVIKEIKDQVPETSSTFKVADIETPDESCIELNKEGGHFDLSRKGFYVDVPPDTVTQNVKMTYSIQPDTSRPSPAAKLETVVSYIVTLGPASVQLSKPITVSLMHSGPGREYGYESVVKALNFNRGNGTWEDREGLKQGSDGSKLAPRSNAKDYIQVQISKLTCLAVVSRLIIDRFEVTPDERCVVTSSIYNDVSLEFPKGTVPKKVNGAMEVLPMPKNIYHDYKVYACPILFIKGFEKVKLLKTVTIQLPHPCPTRYTSDQVKLLRLENDQWEEITDPKIDVESTFLKLHVQHFCGLMFLLPVGTTATALSGAALIPFAHKLYKYLRPSPQKTYFEALSSDALKLTLFCLASHRQEEIGQIGVANNWERLAGSTSKGKVMRPGDEALTKITGRFKKLKPDGDLLFEFDPDNIDRKELCLRENMMDPVPEEEDDIVCLEFVLTSHQDLSVCDLFIRANKLSSHLKHKESVEKGIEALKQQGQSQSLIITALEEKIDNKMEGLKQKVEDISSTIDDTLKKPVECFGILITEGPLKDLLEDVIPNMMAYIDTPGKYRDWEGRGREEFLRDLPRTRECLQHLLEVLRVNSGSSHIAESLSIGQNLVKTLLKGEQELKEKIIEIVSSNLNCSWESFADCLEVDEEIVKKYKEELPIQKQEQTSKMLREWIETSDICTLEQIFSALRSCGDKKTGIALARYTTRICMPKVVQFHM